MDENIVVLQDQIGEDIRFEFLDLIDYKEREYVVLLPEGSEDGEVIILELEEDDSDEMESYVSVEDDEILNDVFSIFKNKLENEFEFTD